MYISSDFKNELKKINNLEISLNEPLKKHTSFKIGGPADFFLTPHEINALKGSLKLIKAYNLPLFILGRGSNIIAGDLGYRGVIIYTGKLNKISIKGEKIITECGVSLSSLANKAMENNLSGLEFASGIPGTIGGAVFMNAGAYGGEIKDILKEAYLLDYSAEEKKLKNNDLKLSYRYSILQEKELIVTEITLELKRGKKEKISVLMKDLNLKRKEKQPLEWPSAGSIFKRPDNYYSGPLIEKAGMKGIRIGDAQVSEKHAGFIINLGNATAKDLTELIKKVQKEVYKTSGILLKVEPEFIGEFA
jgi:UDP-N-acetylmuramate dehydrogenase